VIVAAGLIALGWTIGKAQPRQPLMVKAPAGETRIECVRGCEPMWVERGLNPNDTRRASFSFGCSAERRSSGTVGGWITQ
jgi:hypothetical protein